MQKQQNFSENLLLGHSQSEDTRVLRLTNKFADLRTGYANPCAFGTVLKVGFLSTASETKKPPCWAVSLVAERKGFEPLKSVEKYRGLGILTNF